VAALASIFCCAPAGAIPVPQLPATIVPQIRPLPIAGPVLVGMATHCTPSGAVRFKVGKFTFHTGGLAGSLATFFFRKSKSDRVFVERTCDVPSVTSPLIPAADTQ